MVTQPVYDAKTNKNPEEQSDFNLVYQHRHTLKRLDRTEAYPYTLSAAEIRRLVKRMLIERIGQIGHSVSIKLTDRTHKFLREGV